MGGNQYIIAIGASAGGLEAIHEFFDNLPDSPNSSFVIIQHLSPDYKSLLVELVARHTDMKVFEAADNQEIEPKCVYVIPNTKFITIRKGRLHLTEKKNVKTPNHAVDVFLQSLARDKKEKAVAVILSGTGTDGTKGAEAIKREGGLVIVQDPATAKFDGMPNSVITSGNADFILPPAAIYSEIVNHMASPSSTLYGNENRDDQFLKTIFDLIRTESGLDFNYYKTPTILRRINKRMLQGSFQDPDKYVSFLHDNKEEVKQLGNDFLIGVTRFFRDPEAFDILREKVIPAIIESKEEDDTIKIWVTACSTGEEAYTIAMVVDEVLESTSKNLTVKIFASDIDAEAIQFASMGEYPLSIEKDVEPRLLAKYFTRSTRSYIVTPRIRKQIVFARHNIIKDPPFIKNDLISCRNMLIYISPTMQQRISSLLLFAAGRDGFIFLGPTENSSLIKKDVTEISARWKIYRKTSETKPGYYYQQAMPEHYTIHGAKSGRLAASHKDTRSQSLLWDDFKNVLTEDLHIVVLYIDRNFDIRETVGPYDKYLNLPRRQLHLNLLRMVPSDISVLLSAEIRKAEKSGEKIHLRNVRFKKDEGASALELFIRPGGPGTNNAFTMIMLRESILDDHSGNGNGNGNGHSNGHSNGHGNGAADFRGREEEYVRMLESELNEVRSHLQLAIEDLETTNEELQSTNEELLSANEELQSSNEELQSLNEELITLNTEHQLKIKELLDLNDDLNNYFRSTDIAQVFLDADLRIRRFNPASANMINFIDSDLGRPLTHISNNIRSETLLADVQTVLNTGRALEKEIQLLNGRDFLMRIMPYLHHDGKKDGVIIAFVDIAERKLAEEKIAERTAQLQHLNEALEISNHDLQQFASIASHDLQEPLRKIHMYSTEIQERYGNQLPENVRGYFEKITRCTSRMRTLIIDILNYSRLSAEVPVFKRTDLQAMFNEIVEDFEVAIREKHATVTASPLPEIDLIPGQFRQVLHNLLSNALKFSRPGTPPVITLRAERIRQKSFDSPPDPAGNYYRLTLTDNGIGFEEKFADDVFKLFHRLHSKDRFEGSGIGLAITKKIIERHNGLITTSSSEGIGTRFEMVLPLNH